MPAAPPTLEDLLRGDARALEQLLKRKHAAWEALETSWTSGTACPPALVHALIEHGDVEWWARQFQMSLATREAVLRGPPRRDRHFRRWFAAGIQRHLQPKGRSSLELLASSLWFYVEDDSQARAREVAALIEAAAHERAHHSLVGKALGLLGHDAAMSLRWMAANAQLALAWHAGDDRAHDVTLAAAERAEYLFGAVGDARWRAQATRFRAGALFRLGRIDEALSVLDGVFDLDPVSFEGDRLSRRTDQTHVEDFKYAFHETEPAARALEEAAMRALTGKRHDASWVIVLEALGRTTGHTGCTDLYRVELQRLRAELAREEAEREAELPGPFR